MTDEKIEWHFELTTDELKRLLDCMDGRSWPKFLNYIERLQKEDVRHDPFI